MIGSRLLLCLIAAASLLTFACSDETPRPAAAPDAASPATAAAPASFPSPASSASSPHGLLIARDGGLILRSMTDGAEHLIKPSLPATVYSYPRWSPDGERIVYTVISYPASPNPADWGTRVVLLDRTTEAIVFQTQVPGLTIDGLAWASDGSGLYFATLDPRGAGTLALERLDLASGARTLIARDAAYPAVAPDGRIAYLTFSRGLESGGLWIANADGSDPRRLLTVSGAFAGVRAPRFSPDGRWLAFGAVETTAADDTAPACAGGRRRPWQPRIAAAHGPPISIWIMPVAGGTPHRLSTVVEDDPALAWSPDGATLAVIGACGLYTLPTAGGEAHKLGPGATSSQVDWR